MNDIDWYMSQIKRYRVLNREEQFEEAVKAKAGDKIARDKLINSNLRFVIKIANRYRDYNIPMDELIQEGNNGLVRAIEKFDPHRGFKFISYAVFWIKHHINEYVINNWSVVKAGTTLERKKLFFKLRATRTEIEMSGREPTIKEIAEKLNVSEKNVSDMIGVMYNQDFSLNTPVTENGITTHQDNQESDYILQDEVFDRNQKESLVRKKLWEILGTFSERERYIIMNRLMTNEPKQLKEIGEVFSVSRERIRQNETKLIKKLRVEFEPTGLRPE